MQRTKKNQLREKIRETLKTIEEIERMMIIEEVEEEAMIGEEEVKIEGKEVKSEEGEKEV